MRLPLFWKILLGFWGAYLLLTIGLWFYWSLHPTLVQPDFDPSHAVGEVLVDTGETALRAGGPDALKAQMANWPVRERARFTIAPLAHDSCASSADLRAIARNAEGYCLRYATPPLPKMDEDWFSTAGPPEYLIAIALAGLVFSAGLAAYLSRPIHRLQAGFAQLAKGSLDTRLSHAMGRRNDEIADLARDFDSMVEHLQELVGARDRLLHDVSHELRSPLARMRLAADLLRRDPARLDASLDRIDREAGHLDALVGELLTLARLESNAGIGEDYFDLLDVLRMTIEDIRFEADAMGVKINADLPPDGTETEWLILGNGQLVHRAVENILRNSLRFSSPRQTITLALYREGADGCKIVIEDEGPGIADGEASLLLEPFVQGVSQAGQGFGLGLGIARRAIAASRGSIALTNRDIRGLRVTVCLPLAHSTNLKGALIW
ncbi:MULTISPECIES: HAMP domain-containing sensor histidine kinase [Brevundimonas]|uniref:HAMP domain-containing sensor histidine kinase n=1 Tax=Brevundimonas TaxID=41275 RepID=UPI003207DA9E